jgi:hypothetical protein
VSPLERLPLPIHEGPLPAKVESFLADAEIRVRELVGRTGADRVVEFSPANYALVARALLALRAGRTPVGDRFLEWGSGLGIATCLAALAGFDARGVEIEAALVADARRIAADHTIDATFATESYRVAGSVPIDADLVYAYPWPAEENSVFGEFERRAPEGRLLLTFHGGGDLRLFSRS